MAKKKQSPPPSMVSSPPEAPISSWGFRLIGAGAACVLLGFVLLWFSDPSGQNLPSHLSPFFILAGYGIIGLGLITPDPTI